MIYSKTSSTGDEPYWYEWRNGEWYRGWFEQGYKRVKDTPPWLK